MSFDALALIRDAVVAGEWWRLWTGHLAHTGVRHLGWNLAALIVVGFSALRYGLVRASLIYLLLSMPLISVGLLVLLPDLQWYAGMSGVLHGLVALILVARLSPAAWLGLGLLTVKLVLETAGAWPAAYGDYPVVSQAHALGAACGLVVGMTQCIPARSTRYRARRHPAPADRRGRP